VCVCGGEGLGEKSIAWVFVCEKEESRERVGGLVKERTRALTGERQRERECARERESAREREQEGERERERERKREQGRQWKKSGYFGVCVLKGGGGLDSV